MEWIEFKINVPKFNTSVLVTDKDGFMEVADVQELEGKICLCTTIGYGLLSDSNFTHWMHLPEFPCALAKATNEAEALPMFDVSGQSELYVCECKVCGKPFGDKLSLYEHYDEEHNKQTY